VDRIRTVHRLDRRGEDNAVASIALYQRASFWHSDFSDECLTVTKTLGLNCDDSLNHLAPSPVLPQRGILSRISYFGRIIKLSRYFPRSYSICLV
jgi:hypothetical protein